MRRPLLSMQGIKVIVWEEPRISKVETVLKLEGGNEQEYLRLTFAPTFTPSWSVVNRISSPSHKSQFK